jgi:hypothetical protein
MDALLAKRRCVYNFARRTRLPTGNPFQEVFPRPGAGQLSRGSAGQGAGRYQLDETGDAYLLADQALQPFHQAGTLGCMRDSALDHHDSFFLSIRT